MKPKDVFGRVTLFLRLVPNDPVPNAPVPPIEAPICGTVAGDTVSTVPVPNAPASSTAIPVTEVPHVCNDSPECDEHRADAWLKGLVTNPLEGVAQIRQAYINMLGLARSAVHSTSMIHFYQVIITVLTHRNADSLSVWDDEIMNLHGSLCLRFDDEERKTIFTIKPPVKFS
jgi:hypothetical protein